MITTSTTVVSRPQVQAAVDSSTGERQGALLLFWHRLALPVIVLCAAVLDAWQLDRIGYANSYYTAAVKSMLQSWHTFFFVSFDPGGFVTIDKPPLGFWIETASAKLFGFSGISILLPEVVAGVLSVVVLYRLVARTWGHTSGLLAALFLAVTPVSVVTSRNNTIDSLLVLTVLLAAWAVLRATETGRLRWLLLGATLIGLGFNIKMLEAYLIVPACGLLYLWGAPGRLLHRLGHLALSGVALLVVSLSWAVAVDLTPANLRPYVGSSGTNSELNLALGYNGLSRLSGGTGTPGGGGGGNGLFNGGPAGVLRLLGTTLGGQVGWLLVLAVLGLGLTALSISWRHADDRGRSLVFWGGWLLTAGTFFSIAQFFHPYYTVMLAPAIAALAAIGVTALWQGYRGATWRGWLLPLTLLAAAGAQVYILRDYPDWSRWLTPLLIAATAVATLFLTVTRLRRGRAHQGLKAGLVGVGIAVAALMASPTAWATYSVTHQVSAGIPTAGPLAQTADNQGFSGSGGPGASRGTTSAGASGPTGAPGGPIGLGAPAGSPSGVGNNGFGGPGGGGPGGDGPGGGFGGPGNENGQSDTALIAYLVAHQGAATYLVATASSMEAAPIIIATGKPVMALGGFSGNDHILTTQQFAALVKAGTVRYVLVGSGGPGQGGNANGQGQPGGHTAITISHTRVTLAAASSRAGSNTAGSEGRVGPPSGGPGGDSGLTQWVTSNCTIVPSSQYEKASSTAGSGGSASALYRCGGASGTTAR